MDYTRTVYWASGIYQELLNTNLAAIALSVMWKCNICNAPSSHIDFINAQFKPLSDLQCSGVFHKQYQTVKMSLYCMC